MFSADASVLESCPESAAVETRRRNSGYLNYFERTKSPAGDEIKGFPANLILCFAKGALSYSWTGVFGMAALVVIGVLVPIKNIGMRKLSETESATAP
jgi:hypothetical protein